MQTLRLVPGVNVEQTPSLVQSGYASASLIRFRNGLMEKLGGWAKYFNFSVSGIPRALNAWQDRNGIDYLGIGTTTFLGTLSNTLLTDLTPQSLTSDFAPSFSTAISTKTVTVTDPNISDVSSFDSVEFKTPVSVGGIVLSGAYPITLSLSTHSYQIIAATDATATVVNGGNVPEFTTSSGNSTVTVALDAHGLSEGGTIVFPLATTLGGVTIIGAYEAISIVDANNFTIGVNTQATSSTSAFMNFGNAEIVYAIALAPIPTVSGYSVGTYSTGGYSTGVAVGQQTGAKITATDWTLTNWGDTLLACPDGGGVYAWQPNSGLQNAQLVATAPIHNTGIFVSMQTQMLVCYGAAENNNIGIQQNPLLVAWSDIGDYTSFGISVTSQAGSRVLSQGSKIIFGMACPLQELIWTDLDCWAMTYQGSLAAGVWGFNIIGANAGMIGKHAAVQQGSNVFWMGISNFWTINIGGGAPQPIPCTVWDAVFQNLNTAYQSKCFAWSNSPFNEIWFFFPRKSTLATECDCYVKYNTLTGLWDNTQATFDRTCGIDQSVLGMPISATSTGIIYQHEVSPDADGQPLNWSCTTGWFALSEGQDTIYVDWLLPDFKWGTYAGSQGAVIQITLETVYYPGDTPINWGTFSVNAQTQFINPFMRGRLARLTFSGDDIGSFVRLGGVRYRGEPDGRWP